MDETERQKYLQIVTRKLVGLTSVCIFCLAAFLYIIKAVLQLEQTYLVAFVFMLGLIGGFVSIQQRLPSIGLIELRELSGSWLSILLVPINGGIFAIVLHIMFLSGLIKGSMFPEYNHAPFGFSLETPQTAEEISQRNKELVTNFDLWLATTFPKSGVDIAKLFFWAFVAGFSERFVPQIIRKTTEKGG